MREARIIILALGLTGLALIGAGCASSSQYVPMPDLATGKGPSLKARIYVLRPSRFWGNNQTEVWDNGELVGETTGRTFLCWERDAGKARIKAEAENDSMVEFAVEAGKSYYLMQHIHEGVVRCRTQLQMVDADDGDRWLRLCSRPDYVASN